MKEILFAVLDTNVWIAGINFGKSKSRKIIQAGGITSKQTGEQDSFEKVSLLQIIILGVLSPSATTQVTSHKQNALAQEPNKGTLSLKAVKSLEARGFEVLGQVQPLRSLQHFSGMRPLIPIQRMWSITLFIWTLSKISVRHQSFLA